MLLNLILYTSACTQIAVNQVNKPVAQASTETAAVFNPQAWLDSLSAAGHDFETLDLNSSLSNIESASDYTFKFRIYRKISSTFSYLLVDWTSASLQLDPILDVILGNGTFVIDLKVELTSSPSTYYTAQIETTLSNLCPTNYVMAPGNAAQNIAPFCVAKYEMSAGGASSSSSLPSNLSRNSSITSCQSLGARYDLITNMEWQSLAWDVEGIKENWKNFTIGDTGGLAGGIVPGSSAGSNRAADVDTSPCSSTGFSCTLETWSLYKRTHFLSTGEIIWDLGGNDAEYVKGDDSRSHGSNRQIALVTASSNLTDTKLLYGSYRDFSSSLSASPYGYLGSGLWNSINTGIIRGGWWGEAGIYRTNLTWGTSSNPALGYRCVYHP